jgi:hypothetical protein
LEGPFDTLAAAVLRDTFLTTVLSRLAGSGKVTRFLDGLTLAVLFHRLKYPGAPGFFTGPRPVTVLYIWNLVAVLVAVRIGLLCFHLQHDANKMLLVNIEYKQLIMFLQSLAVPCNDAQKGLRISRPGVRISPGAP